MQDKIFNFLHFSSKTLCVGALLGLSCAGLNAQNFYEDNFQFPKFIDPEHESFDPNAEFVYFDRVTSDYNAWDYPFSSTPSPVNTPTPDNGSNNTDAFWIQNGTDTAFILGGESLYSFDGTQSFVVYDQTATGDVDQVLFQVGSLGSHPDPESALLYYRETVGGPIQGPLPATNIGYLSDNSGGNFIQAISGWEWDLRGITVAEYYITYSALGSSMSYKGSLLTSQTGYDPELGQAVFLGVNGVFSSPGVVTYVLDGGSAQLGYQPGDSVVLTATPNDGYVFLRWEGDIDSSDSSVTITMPADDFNATAIFTPTGYDYWRNDHIIPSMFEGNPAVNGLPTADPNNNGLNNILEYALGGEPEIYGDVSARPVVALSDDGQHLTLIYDQLPFATDLTYRVLVSSDGQTWHYNGDGLGGPYTDAEVSTIYNDNGTQTVVVTDLTALSSLPTGTVRQMRLEVIYTP